MYEYIKGIFVGMNKDYIIIDNSGIGYKIFTSGSTIAKMPKTNEMVILYLQQIVREDFIGLYGFLSKDELNMFNLLLTINGIGAKASLSLLSISTIDNLKYAILTGDEKTITKAPGVGKKTAQRIILELKDKIELKDFIKESNMEDQQVFNRSLDEALEALVSLGYSEKEAEQALKMVPAEESLENIIKSCLKYLMN
ncbi:Holliday junction branch migration protein RuvA [Clostridium omnivorum]|uniref:Holliday junction branch migration complex subunit RuvA n=1 Tax=Clostridium omnivorum TaxID=1604902 RepID=A0ABQ5N0E2_9CLOT|nr:Holliday junction branch migration protein RuvA [Clostridium sp. E14]GLC28638.1 Holliday junction ATP-dependent DNA helicase RuvA [Clostridium sp. E14]